jgi:hypothetical protein
MIWDPVFCPDGRHVAAKAERDGRYFLVGDGKVAGKGFDQLWDPSFNADGSKILLRYVEDGKYYRQVVPTNEMLG